ncbi:MAG: ABC transporter permease [Candidatus Dormibacteraeota bacterium]|nr:ABC transporter permease [Candidatus Dormibacteraeota bacterium]MDQ6901100.1 ABC transporter permease [Candidatus Dormibacteraeota bacterium]
MEIVRNLTRRKLRSILTISGIVIGIFALTTMGAMAEHFNALIDGGVTYYSSSVQVGPPDGQSAALLPTSKITDIKKIGGVAAAFPGYSFPLKPGDVGSISFGVPDTIVAGDPAEHGYGALRTTVASGRYLSDNGRGEVVLGSTVATELKKSVGDSVDLPVRPKDARPGFVNHPFKVIGTLASTRTAPDSFAYLGIADGQMLLKDSLPQPLRDTLDVSQITQGITVYGREGASLGELDQIANRINAAVPGVKATKPSQLVQSFKSGGATFTFITTGAAVLALVIGGLSVINTMIMAVTERTREIGLKKAVGAHMRHLILEYLAEATLIGLVGGVTGYLLGVGLTNLINAAGRSSNLELFLVTPSLTVLAIGFAVALGALAGLIPAFRAARLDPVTALRMAS